MTLASPWYDSGTFWSAAGAVITVFGIIAGAWVAFRVAFPRRRLYYGMRAAAPLLNAAGVDSDLELLHRGRPLTTNPHVVTIELTSRGRLDIDSGAYDSRQPLQLALGARIVEVLQVTSVPDTALVPKITPDGTALKIGPSLIGKRQQVTIDVLTDGGKPRLSCKSPLVNVQVRERDYEQLPGMSRRTLIILSIAVGIGLTIGAAFATSDLIGPPPNGPYYHLIGTRHFVQRSLPEFAESPSLAISRHGVSPSRWIFSERLDTVTSHRSN